MFLVVCVDITWVLVLNGIAVLNIVCPWLQRTTDVTTSQPNVQPYQGLHFHRVVSHLAG